MVIQITFLSRLYSDKYLYKVSGDMYQPILELTLLSPCFLWAGIVRSVVLAVGFTPTRDVTLPIIFDSHPHRVPVFLFGLHQHIRESDNLQTGAGVPLGIRLENNGCTQSSNPTHRPRL